MDPTHNFPPSPREMYMYQPPQRLNGHKVSPSPTRGRPPPVLPERKPETQLSNRASRPSLSSLDSASFDVASPPHSPGYPGSRQLHHGQAHYPDSKPFSYAAAINSQQTAQKQGVHEDSTKVKVHRDHSPRSQRGNVVSEGHANVQGYVHADDYAAQNTATIYQRIDRNRTVSSSDTLMSSGQDCYESDTFHSYDSFGQSEGIYGQFVQPSNGSHHRPSLTYVPPPVVPTLPDFGKVDKPAIRDQQPHLQEQQLPKVKAPTAQAAPPPPPPPPARTSSTPQLLTNHLPDLNSAPAGIRSPRSGSPARHHVHRQTSLATMDDLAQIKLRTVGDSTPSSPVLSPVTASDIGSGAINVKLRPTPGKFRNIYAEDETTLPPPPPLDDLDELPPPPPPPELLSSDLGNLNFNTTAHQKLHGAPPAAHPSQQHCLPGEADSLHVDHRLVQQQTGQRLPVSTPKTHNPDSAGSKAGACGGSKASEITPSGLGQLIAESAPSMEFEIPDDIDLSQCPGLVEITKSTPNWKKDMLEKKNQEKIEEYVKAILKEREQQAKWKNVPEWKRKILQKKEEEDAAAITTVVNQSPDVKTPTGKKPAKKAPVPPPKETKEDPAQPKPKGDIVPAALSIDPEELAAMPPWKQELLFKRGKVPVTFSNEFNPDEEEKADNENVPAS
ncbi:hypothetical protein BsWGS_09723 [Bradybaena similaris]